MNDKAYKRPWFWLLIILIISAAVRLILRDDLPETLVVHNTTPQLNNNSYHDTDTVQLQQESQYITDEVQKEKNTESGGKLFHIILNKNTKKYHTSECSGAKKLSESKRYDTDIEADSLEAAEEILKQQGYEPCGICAKQVQ